MSDEGFESEPTNEVLIEAFKAYGDTIEINLRRDRHEEGRSFSKEALERTRDQMMLFLGAKMLKAWEDGPPPQEAHITLKVEIDP